MLTGMICGYSERMKVANLSRVVFFMRPDESQPALFTLPEREGGSLAVGEFAPGAELEFPCTRNNLKSHPLS